MLYLKNLGYHPPASHTEILRSVNLEIVPQTLGLIIGPSGSGKTTLLEILSGLAEPTSGQISWRDRELLPEQLRQLAGLVFQFPERHFCGGTILEELRLGHPEITTQQVEIALEEVGLSHLNWLTSPYALSGGQQRRLALAVQLIRQPQILLLDEPTAGLDWSMRRQLVALLVTHDAGELMEVADRAWTIERGKVDEIDPQAWKMKRPQGVKS